MFGLSYRLWVSTLRPVEETLIPWLLVSFNLSGAGGPWQSHTSNVEPHPLSLGDAWVSPCPHSFPWQLCSISGFKWASQVARVVKNPPANGRDIKDMSSIPGLGRPPGGGHGNPLRYSYLENPLDRGAWSATVHGVVKSLTWLKWLSTHTHALNTSRCPLNWCFQAFPLLWGPGSNVQLLLDTFIGMSNSSLKFNMSLTQPCRLSTPSNLFFLPFSPSQY